MSHSHVKRTPTRFQAWTGVADPLVLMTEDEVTDRCLSPELLWRLPRVGAPAPAPDGGRVLVPVTSYDLESNEGTSRLWLIEDGRAHELQQGSQPAWSPDGSQVAFVRKPEGEEALPQLWLSPTHGSEAVKLTDLPWGVSDPKWLPDGSGIVVLAALPDGMSLAEAAAERNRRKDSKLKARVTENRLYRYWDRWLAGEPNLHFVRVDARSGEARDLTPRQPRFLPLMDPAGSWDISPDGREIAFTANRTEPPYDDLISGVYLLEIGGGDGGGAEPRLISGWTASNASRPRYSPDGRRIVFGMQEEEGFYGDRVRLVAYERATGKHVVLTEHWDRSCEEWAFADNDTLLFVAEDQGAARVYRLDLRAAKKAPKDAEPACISDGGSHGGLAVAGGRVFSSCHDLRHPPEVCAMDLDGANRRALTEFTAPLLAELPMGDVESLTFEGAEGAPVQMFVIHPPGRKSERHLPLVHLVHGGPHGMFGDAWQWRWCAQVFAAQGWRVAMVNFHGSTSWGHEFAHSILGEWARRPYEDLMRATDLLVERGLADPQRMAAAGGSYGGYLVAWLAANTERFRCLVNHAGVSDLQAQYARDITSGREKSVGGEPWGNQEGMDRYNPMRHSRGFKTPMLIIHGEQDYRVPYTQALQTYNAYKAQGREARLVVYPDEGHWILKPQNAQHWWGEVLGWIKRWLE
jgi:dipeptidyl aminopeptidase/acylaminoacyl peptidase